METGHKVSAVVHAGLILWVMLFDLFSAPDSPRPPAVTEVALISAEELAALSAPAPQAPLVDLVPPPPPPAPAPPPPPPPPPPPAEAITPPAPVAPPQAAVISDAPPPPDSSLTPVQRPVERVGPEAVAPSTLPEARVDQTAVAPDPAAPPAEAPPAQEATARPAAATETVTEATRLSETEPARRTATAPEVSLRPRPRPAMPTPAAQPARPPEPQTPPPPPPPPSEPAVDPTAAAVARALEEALAAGLSSELAGAGGFESPFSDPSVLSQGEIDRLRLAVEECWNVGILSTDALQVVVTISFEMTPDARPIASTIRQVEASGSNPLAQRAAFDAGRRAIEECGINGYGLPPDLYDQWRSVEIVFNPARMRTR